VILDLASIAVLASYQCKSLAANSPHYLTQSSMKYRPQLHGPKVM